MFNDPFEPFTTLRPDETSYWDPELGKLFTFRHDKIIEVLRKEGKEKQGMSILQLKEEIDKKHKELDPEGFAKFKEKVKGRKVLIITTGGTILCTTNTDGFLAPTLEATHLFGNLNNYMTDTYEIVETKPFKELAETKHAIKGLSESGLIDSADMVSRLQLVLAHHIARQIEEHKPLGVIVLHGTDTMANTAAALSLYFEELTVPVILTGAMIAPEKPKSDAFGNLKSSIFFAAAAAIKPGVYVCFDSRLYPGTRAIHDASDKERAFRSIIRKQKGAIATLRVGSWVIKDMATGVTKGANDSEAKGIEKREPDKKGYYSPHRIVNCSVNKDYFEKERTTSPEAKVIDLHEPGTSIGITTFPSTKRKIGMILKLFDADEDIDEVARRVFAEKEVGVDFIQFGKPFSRRVPLEERKIVPLEERMGIVFRGFSGTVDDRIILPLTARGVPVVLGSRIRYDIVTNIGEKYATNTELVKAGVIYSEDMVEDMLAAKLSIVLGLLDEKLRKYKREDIINNPEKYLYFVKLLMLINFKGELMLLGVRGKATGKVLEQCKFPISIMAEYLAKNGFKVNPEKLFTEPDDYSMYFYYFRECWLGEWGIPMRERAKEKAREKEAPPGIEKPAGLENMTLEQVAQWVIEKNPEIVKKCREGDNRACGALVRSVMELKSAEPREIADTIKRLLAK